MPQKKAGIPSAHLIQHDTGWALSGSLNFDTAMPLWLASLALFMQHPAQEMQVDLSQVTSVNSAGLALLIEWLRYAQKHQKNLVFTNIPDALQMIAKVAGVWEWLKA